MTALASQATGRSVAGQGSSAAVAASIASLKSAMKEMNERPIEINQTVQPVISQRSFREELQSATGGVGSRPITIRT
jgi:hypothetical protein